MSDERTTRRRAELARSLRTNLENSTQGLDVLDRLNWLLDHLEDYLDRWIGFCNREDMSMALLIQNDLHAMLLIAIDAIEHEMAEPVDCEGFREKWQEFVGTIDAIDAHTEKRITEVLVRRLGDAHEALLSEKKQGHTEGESPSNS